MKKPPIKSTTLALIAVIIPLLAIFVYVGLRSGPLAPILVTTITVDSQSITPAIFGIGTIEARYTYKIGPTTAGRIKQLNVHVGESVKAGQILGEMDPVDIEDRLRSLDSSFKRAEAVLLETMAKQAYAKTQALRYKKLFETDSIDEEIAITKQQELQIADASFSAAKEDVARAKFEREGLIVQKNNLRLIAPADGIVTVRHADPGTTIVAGQAVIEMIDPNSLWVNVRFDQINASGLAKDLPAHIHIRSRSGQVLLGKVLRIEPIADIVTEELLAKVVFNATPKPLPSLGELTEITVDLMSLPSATVIPNATIHRKDGKIGVWKIVDGHLRFSPVKLGASDLEGLVQVKEGLVNGDEIIIYSEKALTSHSRINVVDHIPGVSQ